MNQDNVSLSKKKLNNFTEIKVWENIVQQLEIALSRGKWVFKINNYSGALREVLHRELVEISEDDIAWIEIYFEEKNKVVDPFSSFNSIAYDQAANYSIFLRLNFFNNSLFHNDRISLQE